MPTVPTEDLPIRAVSGAASPAPATPADPRLWRIPRSAVFGRGTLGASDPRAWPRVDRQGEVHMTTNGRAAILLALEALNVGPGDQVLLPTYHCPTMVEPAVRRGAQPVFYPIESQGSASLEYLRALDTSAAKVVLGAHFFGLPQDMRPLRAFCDERKLVLIEDCAHAFFGRSAHGPVGSIGDFAIASLPKFFAVVEGGCLVKRSKAGSIPALAAAGTLLGLRVVWDALELGARAGQLGVANAAVKGLAALKRSLRGRRTSTSGAAAPSTGAESPFDTIDERRAHTRAAAFVRWLVERSDTAHIAAARRRNYEHFAQLFRDVPGMRPLFPHLPEGAVPYVFPLCVDDPQALYAGVRARGVPLYRWDILWPGTPMLEGDVTPRWATGVFQLCCHQSMTPADVAAVAAALRA